MASNNQQSQGGSGSAENKGADREAQKAKLTNLSDEQKNDIANQIDEAPKDIESVKETGALSGRDDAAGGSGDNMSNTSSNEGTERF